MCSLYHWPRHRRPRRGDLPRWPEVFAQQQEKGKRRRGGISKINRGIRVSLRGRKEIFGARCRFGSLRSVRSWLEERALEASLLIFVRRGTPLTRAPFLQSKHDCLVYDMLSFPPRRKTCKAAVAHSDCHQYRHFFSPTISLGQPVLPKSPSCVTRLIPSLHSCAPHCRVSCVSVST